MFRVNPHEHLKIWFHHNAFQQGENKDSFMNLQNRQRLEKMRKTHPQDKITLLYSTHLLTDKAIENLHSFCSTQQITPLVFESLEGSFKVEIDDQLYEYATAEIKAAKENTGGNLAAASDIMRLLVRDHGLYADFDVEINTAMLAPFISIEAPIVTNYISTQVMGGYSELSCYSHTVWIGDINPNMSDEDKNLAQKLQDDILLKIKSFILNSYTNPTKHYEYLLTKAIEDITTYFNQDIIKQILIEKIPDLAKLPNFNIVAEKTLAKDETILGFKKILAESVDKSLIELRASINTKFSDPYEYAINKISADQHLIDFFFKVLQKKFTTKIEKQITINFYSEFLFHHSNDETKSKVSHLRNNPHGLIMEFLKFEHHQLYRLLVISSTGPAALLSFFDKKTVLNDELEKIKPYSMVHYGLNNHFKTKHEMGFNLSVAKMDPLGEGSDMSWTTEGQKILLQREKELRAKIAKSNNNNFFNTPIANDNQKFKKLSEKYKTTTLDNKNAIEKMMRQAAANANVADLKLIIQLNQTLKMNGDINERDASTTSHKTPLHWAIIRYYDVAYAEKKESYENCIKLLIEHHASFDIRDASEKTPADYDVESQFSKQQKITLTLN